MAILAWHLAEAMNATSLSVGLIAMAKTASLWGDKYIPCKKVSTGSCGIQLKHTVLFDTCPKGTIIISYSIIFPIIYMQLLMCSACVYLFCWQVGLSLVWFGSLCAVVPSICTDGLLHFL